MMEPRERLKKYRLFFEYNDICTIAQLASTCNIPLAVVRKDIIILIKYGRLKDAIGITNENEFKNLNEDMIRHYTILRARKKGTVRISTTPEEQFAYALLTKDATNNPKLAKDEKYVVSKIKKALVIAQAIKNSEILSFKFNHKEFELEATKGNTYFTDKSGNRIDIGRLNNLLNEVKYVYIGNKKIPIENMIQLRILIKDSQTLKYKILEDAQKDDKGILFRYENERVFLKRFNVYHKQDENGKYYFELESNNRRYEFKKISKLKLADIYEHDIIYKRYSPVINKSTPEKVRILSDYINEKQPIKFIYDNTEYPGIYPKKIGYDANTNRYVLITDDLTVFDIDKMIMIEKSANQEEESNSFTEMEEKGLLTKVWGFAFNDEPKKVKVKVFNHGSRVAKEKLLEGSDSSERGVMQKIRRDLTNRNPERLVFISDESGTYLLYEDTIIGKDYFMGWIYSFGSSVELLEPIEWRNEIIEMIERNCSKYGV